MRTHESGQMQRGRTSVRHNIYLHPSDQLSSVMWLSCFSGIVLNGFALVILSVRPASPTLHLVKTSMTWQNARSYCKVTYTDLAPVKTYGDLLTMRAEAARQGVRWPIWVGLYDDVESWRWSFHDLPLSALGLRGWSPGEPDNELSKERCGVLKTIGTWRDIPCGTLHPFICYDAHYPGDTRFVGISTPMNWTDAQTYCRSFHTDLATALDATDNGVLQQVASLQGDSWFGLYRDGWTWSDHTKALDVSWAPGKPDNYYGDQNCGRFNVGSLDDMRCSSLHYFFCHYIPPIKRKLVKLLVKSDQGAFAFADVQASLLMKILKKLEERGMSKGITVTWRIQPDGKVFYTEE